jgi:hypothetical protein
MPPSLRRLTRRLGAAGPGFVDAFLRDSRVLPPVLALLALLVFAWVVAGTLVGGSDGERVSNQANVAQPRSVPVADPVAPEEENRDVESYAAYSNKNPFRQLLAPAEGTSAQPSGETTEPPAEATDGTADTDGSGSASGGIPRSTGSGADRTQDTDNDGLTDRREAALAQDPQNPDTDGDGTPDGADDADGDGQPDGRVGHTPVGSNADSETNPGGGTADAGIPSSDASGGGGGGRDSGGGRPGRDDDLLDSGGSLCPPWPLRQERVGYSCR